MPAIARPVDVVKSKTSLKSPRSVKFRARVDSVGPPRSAQTCTRKGTTLRGWVWSSERTSDHSTSGVRFRALVAKDRTDVAVRSRAGCSHDRGHEEQAGITGSSNLVSSPCRLGLRRSVRSPKGRMDAANTPAMPPTRVGRPTDTADAHSRPTTSGSSPNRFRSPRRLVRRNLFEATHGHARILWPKHVTVPRRVSRALCPSTFVYTPSTTRTQSLKPSLWTGG